MQIKRLSLALVFIATLSLMAAVRADDGDKPVKKDKTEKCEKCEKCEKREKCEKKEAKEEHGGSCFTRFWIHTVGGTIGNGLKTGAHKISSAF